MVWKELRERLVFMVMSAFVVWHTIGMMIAPGADNSMLVQELRGVYEPYLSLFRLTTNGISTRRTSAAAICCAMSWKRRRRA